MKNPVSSGRVLAIILALVMAIAVMPAAVFADEANGTDEGNELVVTLFSISDFHGHMTSEQHPNDPGAPRFVSFIDDRVAYYENTTGHRPIVLVAGDNYFGQHISNVFLGEPALRVLNRIGVRYAAVGNHEFSFSNRILTESFNIVDPAERAAFLASNNVTNQLFDIISADNILNEVAAGIPFLAADMSYDDGSPLDWVAPYSILEDWYEDYGVKVAIIGLSYAQMEALVAPADRTGLRFFVPGTAGYTEDETFGWLEDMINDLRAQGAGAVVALTHTSHNAPANTLVDTLLARGNAHLDVFLTGHSHTYANNTQVYPVGAEGSDILRSTEVVAGGHHGRGFGQIQLRFVDGELAETTSMIYGSTTGELIRSFDPDQEVFEWVHGVGATWTRDENGLDLIIDESPAGSDPSLWGWNQARVAWGDQLGPRGVYGRNQHTRNQYLVYLMHDYILRVHPEDIDAAGANGLIVMNNQSAWRGQGLNRLQWSPEDYVRTTDFLDALTFENTLPLFEMRGRDVIELLNMPAGASPAGGPAGAERDPETGLPNWGTMQGQTIAGAFLLDGVWYLSATLEPISDDGIYIFGASNHMFGSHVGTRTVADPEVMIATAGGQNMPLPGNSFGNALGFEVINFVGGQLEATGGLYYSGPRFAMRDGETGMHITIQEAWSRQALYRNEQTEAGIQFAFNIEVIATEGGMAAMEVWGFEAREDIPGNFSYWGAPAMLANTAGAQGSWSGEQFTRDIVLGGAVVRATAANARAYEFIGWFNSNDMATPVSNDPVFIFTATEDVNYVAVFTISGQNVVTLPEYITETSPVIEENVIEYADEVDVYVITQVVEEVVVPAGYAVVTNAWVVNVRAEASTDSTVVSTVRRDDVVAILEGPVHGWYRIQFGDVTGWVFQNFLDLN